MKIFCFIIPVLFLFNKNEQGTDLKSSAHFYNEYGSVIYQFYHQLDSADKSSVYSEDMILFFGKMGSVYASNRKIKQDSVSKAAFDKAEQTGNMNINLGVILPVISERIYTLKDSSSIYLVESFHQVEYLLTESKPSIKWDIHNEIKKILGYRCQKATCSFKGRNYIAWFTSDISFAGGPWKLSGLPGLILEASDAKNQVRFTCLQVNASGITPKLPIAVPKGTVKTNQKTFDKMKTAYSNNSAGYNDYNGISIQTDQVGSSGNKRIVKKVLMNNPLELIK